MPVNHHAWIVMGAYNLISDADRLFSDHPSASPLQLPEMQGTR